MKMIDAHNLSDVLGGIGVKLCVGLENRKCYRPRRAKGRLCVECHRSYMKDFMAKKRGGKTNSVIGGSDANRARVVDNYDFNQENL